MTDTISVRKKIYVAMSNSDLNEGKGRQYPLFFCWLRATAVRLGKKKYVQGTDCPIKESWAYMIDGHWHVKHAIQDPTIADEKAETMLRDIDAATQKALDAGLTIKEVSLLVESGRPK